MAGNPWQVESILAFYCLKCPECDFNSKAENYFVHHAKEYHPLSRVLFDPGTTIDSAPTYNENIDPSQIKQEQISDDYYHHSDDRPTTESLPLSLSYPDVSINEYDSNGATEFKTEFLDEKDPLKSSKEEKIPCKICKKIFDRRYMKIHIASVHEGVKHKCSACDQTFAQKGHLKRHFRTVHEGKKPYTCSVRWLTPGAVQDPICQNGFKTIQKLKEHMEKVHDGVIPHKCSHCEEGFYTKSGLKKHELAAHLSLLTEHPCKLCDKTFPKYLGLQSHIKTVHERIRPFSCEVCGKTFPNRDHLKRHHDSVHVGIKSHICNICGKGFAVKDYLKRHITEVHSHEGVNKIYKCSECEDSFSRSNYLTAHFDSNHIERICNLCPAQPRFTNKKELRSHMVSVHKQEKVYDCNMCDANFKDSKDLKTHIASEHLKPQDQEKHKVPRINDTTKMVRCFGGHNSNS